MLLFSTSCWKPSQSSGVNDEVSSPNSCILSFFIWLSTTAVVFFSRFSASFSLNSYEPSGEANELTSTPAISRSGAAAAARSSFCRSMYCCDDVCEVRTLAWLMRKWMLAEYCSLMTFWKLSLATAGVTVLAEASVEVAITPLPTLTAGNAYTFPFWSTWNSSHRSDCAMPGSYSAL